MPPNPGAYQKPGKVNLALLPSAVFHPVTAPFGPPGPGASAAVHARAEGYCRAASCGCTCAGRRLSGVERRSGGGSMAKAQPTRDVLGRSALRSTSFVARESTPTPPARQRAAPCGAGRESRSKGNRAHDDERCSDRVGVAAPTERAPPQLWESI
eukprot:364374-Chlamydomonas_euryale.AAC.10